MVFEWPTGSTVPVKDFRDAMASMAATVCLVSAAGEPPFGRIVTSAFSLTLSPPSVLISLDGSSALTAAIRRSGTFSFAALSGEQWEIAEAFTGKVPADRRFGFGNWTPWPSGNPRLGGAVVTMDCEVTGSMDVGPNTLFAGAVIAVDAEPSRVPLLWHQRRYDVPGGTTDAERSADVA